MLPLLIISLVNSKIDINYMQVTLDSPNPLTDFATPLLAPSSISGSPIHFWLLRLTSDSSIHFYLFCSILDLRSHAWLLNLAPNLALSARELRWITFVPMSRAALRGELNYKHFDFRINLISHSHLHLLNSIWVLCVSHCLTPETSSN